MPLVRPPWRSLCQAKLNFGIRPIAVKTINSLVGKCIIECFEGIDDHLIRNGCGTTVEDMKDNGNGVNGRGVQADPVSYLIVQYHLSFAKVALFTALGQQQIASAEQCRPCLTRGFGYT